MFFFLFSAKIVMKRQLVLPPNSCNNNFTPQIKWALPTLQHLKGEAGTNSHLSLWAPLGVLWQGKVCGPMISVSNSSCPRAIWMGNIKAFPYSRYFTAEKIRRSQRGFLKRPTGNTYLYPDWIYCLLTRTKIF